MLPISQEVKAPVFEIGITGSTPVWASNFVSGDGGESEGHLSL